MFDIASSELMLVGAVALVVIGPKDLPKAMRFVGQWVGRARGMARHFRAGFDEMVRQSELEEMEKRWAAENARIMAEHPAPPPEEAYDAIAAQPGGYDEPPVMTALPAPAEGEDRPATGEVPGGYEEPPVETAVPARAEHRHGAGEA